MHFHHAFYAFYCLGSSEKAQVCWLCWWSCAWADQLYSDIRLYTFSVQGIVFSVVFCCRLTVKPSTLFYARRVAEKKSRTHLKQLLDCPAVLVVLTWYLEWYVKLAGIISRQWALSNFCIMKIFYEGLRNFGRMRIDSSIYLFESIALNAVRRISIDREVQCPPKTPWIFSYVRETGFPTV